VQPPRAEEPAADDRAPQADAEPVLDAESVVDGEPVLDAEPVVDAESEDGQPAGTEAAAPEEAEPEDELTVAQRERGEYLALAQRTQADFENYRKRAAKETAIAGRRAKSGLIGELLPVVDNLERALASAGEQEEHLADGVRLVHSELISVLARNGVEQFDPAGQKFDPSVHEALSTRSADDAEPGVVLDVVEKGYSLNEVVLRPARVVVSA
jgi:molecular chaperone GrpE